MARKMGKLKFALIGIIDCRHSYTHVLFTENGKIERLTFAEANTVSLGSLDELKEGLSDYPELYRRLLRWHRSGRQHFHHQEWMPPDAPS